MSGLRIPGTGLVLRTWVMPAVIFLLATLGAVFLAYQAMQAHTPLIGADLAVAGQPVEAEIEQQRALVYSLQDPGGRGALANTHDVQMTPELHMQRMRERASDLDQNFMEDPRNPNWAGPMEARIRQMIANSGFVGEEEYGIASHSTDCRSHGCRIELVFQNDMMTDEATMLIREELTGLLNEALTVPLPRPDGSIEYRIYAVTEGHGALLRKRRSDASLVESVPR